MKTLVLYAFHEYNDRVKDFIKKSVFKQDDIDFMGADDIPAVLGYLIDRGYKVDTSLTKMLYQSRVEIGGASLSGDRKMIAMITLSI
jgi:hypothetical protein